VGIRVTAYSIISEVSKTKNIVSLPRQRNLEKANAAIGAVSNVPTSTKTTISTVFKKY